MLEGRAPSGSNTDRSAREGTVTFDRNDLMTVKLGDFPVLRGLEKPEDRLLAARPPAEERRVAEEEEADRQLRRVAGTEEQARRGRDGDCLAVEGPGGSGPASNRRMTAAYADSPLAASGSGRNSLSRRAGRLGGWRTARVQTRDRTNQDRDRARTDQRSRG